MPDTSTPSLQRIPRREAALSAGPPHRWLAAALPTALMLLMLQAGCVFAPRTISVYDPDCQITSRQMILQAEQMPVMGHCRGEECGAMLVVFGAVSAATAVISGSIVVVGNVVYWFEKQNQCRRVDAVK
jgi:hypothetical protein